MQEQQKEFPTVDIIVVIKRKQIILIRRGHPPFEGMLAFPGGHVDEGETLEAAAVRELYEEVNLKKPISALEKLMVLNDQGRDPRPGHSESTVFVIDIENEDDIATCKAGDDAASFEIKDIDAIKDGDMAFDHYSAIIKLKEWRDNHESFEKR